MARNLRDKIRTLVQDAYDLRQESVVTKIENLIKDEMQLRDEERDLTYYDLVYIKSLAVQEFTAMNMTEPTLGKLTGDQEMIRLLCLVNAINGFLRSKGLTPAIFKYKK